MKIPQNRVLLFLLMSMTLPLYPAGFKVGSFKKVIGFIKSQWNKKGKLGKTGIVLTGLCLGNECEYRIRERLDKKRGVELFNQLFPLLKEEYYEEVDLWDEDRDTKKYNIKPVGWSKKKKLLVKYMVDIFNELSLEELKIVNTRVALYMHFQDRNRWLERLNFPRFLYLFCKSVLRVKSQRDRYEYCKRIDVPHLYLGIAATLMENYDLGIKVDQEKVDWGLGVIHKLHGNYYEDVAKGCDAYKVEQMVREYLYKN